MISFRLAFIPPRHSILEVSLDARCTSYDTKPCEPYEHAACKAMQSYATMLGGRCGNITFLSSVICPTTSACFLLLDVAPIMSSAVILSSIHSPHLYILACALSCAILYLILLSVLSYISYLPPVLFYRLFYLQSSSTYLILCRILLLSYPDSLSSFF